MKAYLILADSWDWDFNQACSLCKFRAWQLYQSAQSQEWNTDGKVYAWASSVWLP